MGKEILIILPSRCGGSDRTKNVERFIENWKKFTEGFSDLCVAIDEDESEKYPRIEGVIYEVNPRMRMIPTLNHVANKYSNDYKAISFFGDDHLILSKWESIFLEKLDNMKGVGIFYGNDLFQGAKLPTAVFMSSNIVRELGYMVPNQQLHMFADNFWKELGDDLGILCYFDNIIFEHVHPDIGKIDSDSQYLEANSAFFYDQEKYNVYKCSDQWIIDREKIKSLIS